jgi:hypothetical protein
MGLKDWAERSWILPLFDFGMPIRKLKTTTATVQEARAIHESGIGAGERWVHIHRERRVVDAVRVLVQ